MAKLEDNFGISQKVFDISGMKLETGNVWCSDSVQLHYFIHPNNYGKRVEFQNRKTEN